MENYCVYRTACFLIDWLCILLMHIGLGIIFLPNLINSKKRCIFANITSLAIAPIQIKIVYAYSHCHDTGS